VITLRRVVIAGLGRRGEASAIVSDALLVALCGSEAFPLLKVLFLGHVAVQRMCSAPTLGEKPGPRPGLSPRVAISVGLRERSRDTESRSRTRGCESGASIGLRQQVVAKGLADYGRSRS
jgi:hypothetical protein